MYNGLLANLLSVKLLSISGYLEAVIWKLLSGSCYLEASLRRLGLFSPNDATPRLSERVITLYRGSVSTIKGLTEVFTTNGNISVIAANGDFRTLLDGVPISINSEHHRCLPTTVADRF